MNYTLRELLEVEAESLILVDGSISEGGISICRDIYESKNYSELKTNQVNEAKDGFKDLETIFAMDNSCTITEVAKEIKEFERIINNKLQELIPYKNPKKRGRHSKDRIIKCKDYGAKKSIEKKAEKSLRELQERVFNLRKLAENSLIHKIPGFRDLNDTIFDNLFEATCLISDALSLKKDTSYLMGERPQKKISYTDEKISATNYRLSLKNKGCCLLTQDGDFIRILGTVTRIIGSDYFLPHNKIFRGKLKQFPFRLYFKDPIENDYSLKVNSNIHEFERGFWLRKVDKKGNHQIKRRLTRIWENIQNKCLMLEYERIRYLIKDNCSKR